ncbi:uncharacterized protein LY89DRAFT_488387 [Mollisia scopiformis]|uniref:Nuclear pore complex protein An-Nup82 n=1 Tax=Mollisia scopiformis TaxID=149040 RepID=A0A194XGJ2_MOLSC|nr:uncharacterized protein LY89DRAFT_488387 [Mollisia scopiformis]KUJ19315.1 hypothetical protein LY89DRAFT_488387 [Mollisia scopiformis]
MPKIVSFTPEWLSSPPASELFKPTATDGPRESFNSSNGFYSSSKRSTKPGPRRTIARRGTEVFIAVGKEIRWADLIYLKETHEDKKAARDHGRSRRRDSSDSEDEIHRAEGYRTIKTPVAEDIRQLVISPHSNYIAILTTHTVHIALLPEPGQLTARESGPLKMKTYTLGPTTHVTSQSGIASALWHPLGVNGTCLVTVTEDAIVRVWELSTADRWSFDRPTLAIDLKKLADGTSVDQDFGASVAGASKGFSPDSFEMEVASACFAGRGSGGWSPMTLWVAMREGDIYALCPLLPEKWSPPPTLIPSLSISIVANVAAMEDDPTIPQMSKMLAQQQLAWMSEIDAQEPVHVEGPPGDPPAEVYTRPAKPGRVPKLQGPFEIDLAPEESEDKNDGLLSDISVIGAKIDAEELMFGEEDDLEDDNDHEGLSIGVVCFMTTSGRLSICLDLDGVEAQWLPKTKSKALRLMEEPEPPSLMTFEVLDLLRGDEPWDGNWPVFSSDFNSRYSFFVTDTSSITFISLQPWVFRLERELNEASAGSDFRLDLLANGQNSTRERFYTHKSENHLSPLAACEVVQDPDLGYFLLSATPYGPVAIDFEATTPDSGFEFQRSATRSPTYDPEPDKPLILCEPRPAYEPPNALAENSSIPAFLEQLGRSRYARLLKEEVRLSPATLQIMTEAHKVLSEETHRVSAAAAELFRRCERLQIDLQSQIKKANDVAARVEQVTGDDNDEGPIETMNELVEKRLKDATERQTRLSERIERMKRKVMKGSSRELSDKEKAWVEETEVLSNKVLGQGEEEVTGTNAKEPWARFEEVKALSDELMEQVEGVKKDEGVIKSPNVKVPSEIRKAKMTQIMGLLDRETALVEAAKSRLERLSLA